MLHLTLYKYTNKPIIVNKTSYLGTGLAVTGDAMTTNQDMENPIVLLSFTSEPDYNYAYIQEYHRYYFLTNKTWVSANVWAFTFHVDELYTYKTLVGSISGIVKYSASGSPLKFDDRLAYNEPPTVSQGTTASSHKDGGTTYIVMRTLFFNSNGVGDTPENSTRYLVFDLANFVRFVTAYNNLANQTSTSAMATAIGKLIQNISLVRWLDLTDYTPITTGKIRFDSPEINALSGAGYLGGYELDLGASSSSYYLFYHDTIVPAVNISWLITNGNYWQRRAARKIYIPYVGQMVLDVDYLGAGTYNNFYMGVSIRYSLSANAYVLTPGIASLVTGADAFDTIFPLSNQVVPNQYSSPFVVDKSFEMTDMLMDTQVYNFIGQYAQSAIKAGQTSGASLPSDVISMASSLVNIGLLSGKLAYAQASSLSAQGTMAGGTPDSVYLSEDNLHELVEPKAFMEVMMVEPAAGYGSFQADHGYPDGEYRTLSSLTGYVQMQEFEMIYDANATKGEMDRLEAQLYRGVIM